MVTEIDAAGAALEMADARRVAAGLRRWVPLGAQMARSWAEAGRIVGWPRGDEPLYPLCQFDAVGLPLPVMREVIAALRPGMADSGIVDWLGQGCAALQGARPADLLQDRPEAVLAAAREAGMHARSAA